MHLLLALLCASFLMSCAPKEQKKNTNINLERAQQTLDSLS